MRVPFLDLREVNARYLGEIEEAMARVVNSGWYVLGSEVRAFEDEFSRYCGARFCIGVSNGLDALHLILRGLGVGAQDEVIVPANTFVATWLAVSYCGAIPVPVETEAHGFNIDPDLVEAAVTTKTKAIIAVHLYGKTAAMTSLREMSRRHGIPLIEDAAQAHGSLCDGIKAGNLANAAAFSFYPGKNLGALGDGGAVTTDDEALARNVRLLRNYGSEQKYEHLLPGFNARLDEMQAAVLRSKLNHLDADNHERRQIAGRYLDELAGCDVELPDKKTLHESVWHLFVIQSKERDVLRDRLQERGVETGVHYPVPPHLQRAYAGLGFVKGDFPITERLHDQVLSLPLWPGMHDAMIDHVIRSVRDCAV